MKTVITHIALDEEEKKLLDKSSKEVGLKLPQFIKMCAITKSKEK